MKKEESKKYKLPENSGVYFFLDKKWNSRSIPPKDIILYVGKATVLKDRVASYFASDLISTRGTKISGMIENAKDIFYIETTSVLEAILLESKYIKELKPFFNTREKDDKSYSFVVFTKEDFPRVLIMREREIEKKQDLKILKKFGPFVSKSELLEIMKFIRKLFPFRDKCKIGEKRGCFNFQIHLCPGTCVGRVSKVKYKKILKQIEKILSGNIKSLTRDLDKQMKSLAKRHNFEEAAEVRNKINSLLYVKDISLIKNEENNQIKDGLRIESYDVSHMSGANRVGVMVVLEGGELEKHKYKKFKLKERKNDDLAGLQEILERRFKHKEWKYPDLIVIDGGDTHLSKAKEILKSILTKEEFESILLVSVVKDNKHKAREILYSKNVDKSKKENYNESIILANAEAHRFAISYHKLLRNKIKSHS
jgi:excinuclease ABC subunit C